MFHREGAVSSTGPKQAIFASLAEVAQALGHAHRLELLEHVAQGMRSVEELSARANLSFANTSRHLQILRRARLVDTERRGKNVLSRLAGDAEVGELVRVSRKELISRLRDGLVTVLDVRPEDEFALGHISGAVNIPLGKLKHRLGELPADREVIAYCRGPYCVLSFEAVAALRAKGYLVRRLEDGYPEWKAAGLPVEAVA
jgi:rhodanese-related sulfurtransferase